MGWDRNSKYFKWGIVALLVIVISTVFVVIFSNLKGFFDVIGAAIRVISPLLYGCIFAYLLNPLVKVLEKRLYPIFTKKAKTEKRAKGLSRALGMVFAFLVFGILVYGLFALVLPQLYDTIASIVTNMPRYVDRAEEWMLNLFANNPKMQATVTSLMTQGYERLQAWLSDGLLANAQTYLAGLTNSVVSVVREFASILIGLVASTYILWSKDTFQAQAKKLVVAVFRESTANRLLHVGRETHRIFSGFIVGKIIDAMIVGVLCYIGMRIMGLPFPVLIATIIGVCNIIPFFGPIIGIVPSAILILFVDPLQAFYFVIFELILQQIDGNIISPRILGDTVGISGFWVLISITVAGNLFGFAGMVLGVPVFALFYLLFTEWTNRRLQAKNRTTVTKDYFEIETTDDLPERALPDPDQIAFEEPETAQPEQEPEKKKKKKE
ncbi:MAG: AI-2E family transporter [Oscillospiraceae bacterium]|nr:AI-2E family transporter [Oscillospiraceae bacterium]